MTYEAGQPGSDEDPYLALRRVANDELALMVVVGPGDVTYAQAFWGPSTPPDVITDTELMLRTIAARSKEPLEVRRVTSDDARQTLGRLGIAY